MHYLLEAGGLGSQASQVPSFWDLYLDFTKFHFSYLLVPPLKIIFQTPCLEVKI